MPRFLAIWDSRGMRIVIPSWGGDFPEGHGVETSGRAAEGSVPAGAGADHRHGPPACAAGTADRLGFPGGTLCRGVHDGIRPTATAGPVDCRALHPEAHAFSLGRGVVRTLAGKSLLPALLRRAGVPSRAALRPVISDSLAPALGGGDLAALLQESLSVAHKSGALETKDLERVAVDTTVQPKAVAHPTDARLMYRAIEKLVALAKREGVPLRQSYIRVGKWASIMVGRYTHAHQFKRARRMLKFLRTRLGRLIRDISRKIDGDGELEAVFVALLSLATRVRQQDQHQRGRKVYALHAPEVECIGKGKARAPYEFGCKVSVATPVTSPKGGQFVLHAKALHGNPYDGHTLGPILAGLEALTGIETRRIHVDKGYRGHNHTHKFRVWISGQVRRVTATIRREMKRRAAVEPVIGHLKAEHRMGRNYLKGPEGDRINAVLAAAGYNFGLLLRWLAELWRAVFIALAQNSPPAHIV